MLRIISEDKKTWNTVIQSFRDWDIYYLFEYCELMKNHGDGDPLLIYYEGDSLRLCYPVLKSDIAYEQAFRGEIEAGSAFDIATPYGYGGPLFEGSKNENDMEAFFRELNNYCIENNIVSQFIRFNPLSENHKVFEGYSNIKTIKKTIRVDLSSIQVINGNMTGKNRNMIRKAEKNNITVTYDKGENIRTFIDIYRETMERNSAAEYYSFSDEYFHDLIHKLSSNCAVFYANCQNSIIGSALVLYNSKYMHYHLAGAKKEYMNLAPGNLLVYELACWGHKKGIGELHLGGGIEEAADSLYSFKKSFNKNGETDFYIGANIFLPDRFYQLVNLRKSIDKGFDENNKRMIKYRG